MDGESFNSENHDFMSDNDPPSTQPMQLTLDGLGQSSDSKPEHQEAGNEEEQLTRDVG